MRFQWGKTANMKDTNGSDDTWETRYHEVMWRMLEKTVANEKWCGNEDPFTVALFLAERDYQKTMYERCRK